MAYAGGSKGTRLGESAVATLPLLAYLALATGLMVADHRIALGAMVRQESGLLAEPVWWLASLPSAVGRGIAEGMASRGQLQEENRKLRERVQVDAARIARLQAQALENQRLRALLDGAVRHRLEVHLAELVDVDLDPYRQRVLLGQGKSQGVRVGQAVMDASGLLGQVIEAGSNRATVLLITDPDHAVPVQAARSGFRGIAYGGVGLVGRPSSLQVPNIPQSADLRSGDVLVTSGLGGRFPPGLPVGVVGELHPDATGLFIVAEVRPAAKLDRGTLVLLLDEVVEWIESTPAPSQGNTGNVDAAVAGASPATLPAGDDADAADTGRAVAEEARPTTPVVTEAKPSDARGQGQEREPRP